MKSATLKHKTNIWKQFEQRTDHHRRQAEQRLARRPKLSPIKRSMN